MSSDFVLAMSKFRRHKYKECEQICDRLLEKNRKDKAIFQLKINCLIKDSLLEDIEFDEQDAAELLLDENQKSNIQRPGTSFNAVNVNIKSEQIVRPISKSGRLMTGFIRPGTSAQNVSSDNRNQIVSRMGTSSISNRL